MRSTIRSFTTAAALVAAAFPGVHAAAQSAQAFPTQVDLMFATAPAVAGHIKSGKLRPLAASVPARLAAFPDVPTMPELGFAEMDVRDWVGIVAPAATPRPVVARIAAEAERALAQAEVRDRLAALGMDPVDSSPDAFAKLIGSELARWTKVVRDAGIKAD